MNIIYDPLKEGEVKETFRPIGLWDVRAPTFSRQSTHRWRWGCEVPAALYSPGRLLVTISVTGWINIKIIVRLERLVKFGEKLWPHREPNQWPLQLHEFSIKFRRHYLFLANCKQTEIYENWVQPTQMDEQACARNISSVHQLYFWNKESDIASKIDTEV
jgi:hypothetical protein